MIIEAQGVSKRYGKVEAVRALNLSVKAGEVVAFLGPNGAGKTTSLNLMLGLEDPTAGEVRVFGARPGGPGVRGRVGVMLQESGLPDTLTVEELVSLVGRYYPTRLPTAQVLDMADLKGKRGALIRTLSGGQKQRLYFALAVVGDPDLIFLDEPTVAMDVDSRRAFWTHVRALAALGKTVLFCTHYLQEADEHAGRIVVLRAGELLADGTPEQIKALVSAKTARLRTPLTPEQALGYPGIAHAARDGDFLHVYGNDPEAFLTALVRAGHPLRDLTVEDADLEAAFVRLTQPAQA